MVYVFDKNKDVEIISEEKVYDGFFQVHQYQLRHKLFKGGWSGILKRELFIRNPVVAALPYDPVLKKVVLIQQFRAGTLANESPWPLEIVAGIIEGDDDPETAIRKELIEESGLIPQKLHKIFEYWISPGGTNEHLTLYYAKVDASDLGEFFGVEEEHEDICVHVIPINEAFDLLKNGKINNSATIIALQWLQLHHAECE